MRLFGLEQAILYVQREKNNFEFASSKEDIRGHVANVSVLIENLIKESIRIYGFLFFGKAYVQKLKETIDVNVDGKLMFGEALKGLSRLHKLLYDSKRKSEFASLFSRKNVYFHKDDDLYEKLLQISRLRGAILHDEQVTIQGIDDYREQGRRCISISEQALNQIKMRQLFPSIVKYHSFTEKDEKNLVCFEDEIGATVPLKLSNNLNLIDVKNRKWYLFKTAKSQRIIPVFTELIAWGNEVLEQIETEDVITEAPTMMALGLLEIKEKEATRWYNIYDQVTDIGRSENNNLIIRFSSISRKHCELIYDIDKNKMYIVDLNSTYGTKVNNISLESNTKFTINQGDVVTLGLGTERVEIIFRGTNI